MKLKKYKCSYSKNGYYYEDKNKLNQGQNYVSVIFNQTNLKNWKNDKLNGIFIYINK